MVAPTAGQSPPPRPADPPHPGRLDQTLVARHLCDSRERAQRLIRAGQVQLNGVVADKPGRQVRADDRIDVRAPERFVSRGGYKLEHALRTFAIEVTGRVALDLGASTGGFTDCLLQHGARRVYAVDVGRGQLAWTLRKDPRVVVLEGVNARHLRAGDFPAPFQPPSLITIDCSFISLRLILPSAVELLPPSGMILALVKPQFEAGKAEADRGRGVITDPQVHERVLRELAAFTGGLPGLHWREVVASPLTGPAGNTEFLAWIEKAP